MKLCSLLLISLLVTLSVTSWAQHSRGQVALLAVECEAKNGVCEIQHLVRFRFKNGELLSKDTILTSETDRIRYDLGNNHIYQNRYVITNWGDVIDVQTKELLHVGKGKYVGTEGDQVILNINNINLEGYFCSENKEGVKC
ncbi:MAG: hypothetical protein HY231_18195 [Acidobacteria bacterium]|nr:hypothetical protein [Acidobacteriota bacterium]